MGTRTSDSERVKATAMHFAYNLVAILGEFDQFLDTTRD